MEEAAPRSPGNSGGRGTQWFSMRGNAPDGEQRQQQQQQQQQREQQQHQQQQQQRFSIGNGALRFIRTRASVKRESKRFGNR
jgi:hypothetical protein